MVHLHGIHLHRTWSFRNRSKRTADLANNGFEEIQAINPDKSRDLMDGFSIGCGSLLPSISKGSDSPQLLLLDLKPRLITNPKTIAHDSATTPASASKPCGVRKTVDAVGIPTSRTTF